MWIKFRLLARVANQRVHFDLAMGIRVVSYSVLHIRPFRAHDLGAQLNSLIHDAYRFSGSTSLMMPTLAQSSGDMY